MSASASFPVRSRARQRLLRLGLFQSDVAARLGVSTQLVGFWWCGRRTPCTARRAQIQAELGIPATDWDVPAGM